MGDWIRIHKYTLTVIVHSIVRRGGGAEAAIRQGRAVIFVDSSICSHVKQPILDLPTKIPPYHSQSDSPSSQKWVTLRPWPAQNTVTFSSRGQHASPRKEHSVEAQSRAVRPQWALCPSSSWCWEPNFLSRRTALSTPVPPAIPTMRPWTKRR